MNTENYQAIYDAVKPAFPEYVLQECIERVRQELLLPSAIYRPGLSIDGNQWCALYGENLQDGVAGFGDSPAEAMAAFDTAWNKKL